MNQSSTPPCRGSASGETAPVNKFLEKLFQDLRAQGFTPGQAAAYWDEVHVLASPILFSLSALRKTPRLRAVAAAHAVLAKALCEIKSPDQWAKYCLHMPLHLQNTQEIICSRWKGCEGVLRDYWPLLAMDEGVVEYAKRTTIGHEMPSEAKVQGWGDVFDRLRNRYALEILCDQMSLPETSSSRSWQRVMNMTGLRSVRWSFGDEPGDARSQCRLMEALLYAQKLLRAGIEWDGPLLGLAGSTSLALTDRGNSDGMVQPDPGGEGQTMTLGHWSVLAHEWVHTLDIALAREHGCKQAWATHAALEWEHDDAPPSFMMLWFWQVERVLNSPPPDRLLPVVREEIVQWRTRALESIGHSLAAQEELTRQENRMTSNTWSRSDAERGWCRVFSNPDGPHMSRRTAHLLACDADFSRRVQLNEIPGYWSEYLSELRREMIEDQMEEDRRLGPRSPVVASMRYLTNAVEVVARSFEASMAFGRQADMVWLPSESRPNAGLLWPTPAEASFHLDGWRPLLKSLRPLWRRWNSKTVGITPPPEGIPSGGQAPR